jgi:hypothetical protein
MFSTLVINGVKRVIHWHICLLPCRVFQSHEVVSSCEIVQRYGRYGGKVVWIN